MSILHDSGSHVTLDPLFLAALLIPETGARMAAVGGPGTKMMAKIFLTPGGGLNRRFRDGAFVHESVSVNVRADTYDGKPAPACAEFHANTLKWAFRNATGVAIWAAPFPECATDYAAWMVEAANAVDFAFQVTIETVPERAAEWALLVERWKGPKTKVRFFGGVQ
jgi:hypothetical protein